MPAAAGLQTDYIERTASLRPSLIPTLLPLGALVKTSGNACRCLGGMTLPLLPVSSSVGFASN